MSEASEESVWYVIMVFTAAGQRIAISQDMDGVVCATCASKDEAIDQAIELSTLIGMAMFNSEEDI